jgi:hypothetical protein
MKPRHRSFQRWRGLRHGCSLREENCCSSRLRRLPEVLRDLVDARHARLHRELVNQVQRINKHDPLRRLVAREGCLAVVSDRLRPAWRWFRSPVRVRRGHNETPIVVVAWIGLPTYVQHIEPMGGDIDCRFPRRWLSRAWITKTVSQFKTSTALK